MKLAAIEVAGGGGDRVLVVPRLLLARGALSGCGALIVRGALREGGFTAGWSFDCRYVASVEEVCEGWNVCVWGCADGLE